MKPFVLDEPVDGTYFPELSPRIELGDMGTGYYNVLFVSNRQGDLGYHFEYIYDMDINSKFCSSEGRGYNSLISISLPHLRKRVLEAGYEWKVIDVHQAMWTLSMNLIDLSERSMFFNKDFKKRYIYK